MNHPRPRPERPPRHRGLPLFLLPLLLAGCALNLPDPVVGGAPQQVEERYLPEPPGVAATPWIEGLETPWSLVFLGDGRALVSERPGRIRLIEEGVLQAEPYAELEAASGGERGLSGAALEAVIGGEGGVLGLALHPDFPARPYVYVYQTRVGPEGVRNRVLRLKDEGRRGVFDRVVLEGIPGWVFHNGGRIGFGPDGLLYVTTGETFEAALAQDLGSLGGKILRITPEGEVPAGNPFPGSPVYSYGHRNPQGLAWHPDSGRLFASEHGPSAEFGLGAYDEINLVEAGGDHGWPRAVGAPGLADAVDPLVVWTETATPPAGLAFHRGDLYLATLASQALVRIELETRDGRHEVAGIETLVRRGAGGGPAGPAARRGRGPGRCAPTS